MCRMKMKKTLSDMRGSSTSSSFPKNGLVELDAAADAASIAAVLIVKTLDASLILFGSILPSSLVHPAYSYQPHRGILQTLPEPHSAKYNVWPSSHIPWRRCTLGVVSKAMKARDGECSRPKRQQSWNVVKTGKAADIGYSIVWTGHG
jgi:hypothetical protein